MTRLADQVVGWAREGHASGRTLRRALVEWYRGSALKRLHERRRRHHPNLARLEIDLTQICNLRCVNCDMSVRQAPGNERMSVAQIERLVDDSLRRGWRWERIRVLGGEPTLHPGLDEVLAALGRYKAAHPDCLVEIVTNGHGPKVRAVLERLPDWFAVDDTGKDDSNVHEFIPFNDAPADDPAYAGEDFGKGCFVTSDCGIGLSRHGFYPCVIAAGMDRILGWDLGVDGLDALAGHDFRPSLERFCRLCGYFKTRHDRSGNPTTEETMSPSWERAYAAWRESRPELTER